MQKIKKRNGKKYKKDKKSRYDESGALKNPLTPFNCARLGFALS